MKRIAVILIALLISMFVWSQVPKKMSYQAVVRNSNGTLVTNSQIGMEINIRVGSPNGSVVYTETQTPTTNQNGLVSIQFGGGAGFDAIDWSNNTYFLETKISFDMVNYDIVGVSQMLSVPYALCAEKVTDISNITQAISDTADNIRNYVNNAISNISTPTTYSVGDFAHGGIVFWVDATGQHGLVCAKNDLDNPLTTPVVETHKWRTNLNDNTTFSRARASGPMSGKVNTFLIVAAETYTGDVNKYAALLCIELNVTEGGVTYGDWYMPSKDELLLMYANKDIINSVAVANGGIPLNNSYWTSTEVSSTNAYRVVMSNGYVVSSNKTENHYIRPIRSF